MNRTMNATDLEKTTVMVATNIGAAATPLASQWIDTRGWSWVDWTVTFNAASNLTAVVAQFEQYSGSTTAPAGYPAANADVREVNVETWDSGAARFEQTAYKAASPTKVAPAYNTEGWTFTTPAHGRFMRIVVYGDGVAAPSVADICVVSAFRRS